VCHVLPPGFNKFKLKKNKRPVGRTRDPDEGIDRLHNCARRLLMLTCFLSPNSSICSLCRQVDMSGFFQICFFQVLDTHVALQWDNDVPVVYEARVALVISRRTFEVYRL
jgi:hypothetical protein